MRSSGTWRSTWATHDYSEPEEWPGPSFRHEPFRAKLVDPASIYLAAALCRAMEATQLLVGTAEVPVRCETTFASEAVARFVLASGAADEAAELLVAVLGGLLEREGVFEKLRSLKEGERCRIETGRSHGQKAHRDACRKHHEIIRELVYAYEDKVGDGDQPELTKQFCTDLTSEVGDTLEGDLPQEALDHLNASFVRKYLGFYQTNPLLFKAFIEAFSSEDDALKQ